MTPTPPTVPSPDDYLAQYERLIALLGGLREWVWGSMVYGCQDRPRPAHPPPPNFDAIYNDPRAKEHGYVKPELDADGNIPAKPEGCGWDRRVYLCLGVEGPEWLRCDELYIPAPFVAGTCPQCGLPLSHARWADDETFEWPRPAPDGEALFLVPTESQAVDLAKRGYGGAYLRDLSQVPGT